MNTAKHKNPLRAAIFAAACVLISPCAIAQQASDDSDIADEAPAAEENVPSVEAVTAYQEPIDEIIVESKPGRSYLRKEVIKAEDAFYDMYNKLASEDDFIVVCERVSRDLSTRVKVRKCESKYEARIAYEINQRNLDLGTIENAAQFGRTRDSSEFKQQAEERREDQLKDMERVLEENPEFVQKLIELNKAQTDYLEARSR
ncbi:MAG: hypothetical protein AAF917_01420 [Pseudomonadota bacterium]